MRHIPIELIFTLSVLIIVCSIEVGFRVGRFIHRHSKNEKEAPVSAISGTTMGLLAFILAFTFAIVTERFDSRKELVRDEANVLRTIFLRSEFLSPNDHAEAVSLLKRYVELRVLAVQSRTIEEIGSAITESEQIQNALWSKAVANARRDMNSDVGALYIEALNEMMSLHALRVTVGLHLGVPTVIWCILLSLVALGMFGIGYQTAIAGSRRTLATFLLAVSFSLVIAMIAELDRPDARYLVVPQQPLIHLKQWMISWPPSSPSLG